MRHIYNSTQYKLVEDRPSPDVKKNSKEKKNNNNKQIKMPPACGSNIYNRTIHKHNTE